jgi:hypothetical protein
MDDWVVVLDDGELLQIYGPLNAVVAEEFCKFLCAAVGPATVRKLHSPTWEVLAWWKNEIARNDKGAG